MEDAPGIFSAYRGRRVLVTGASGFIGRWVARALSRAGADLWLLGRNLEALHAVCADFGIHGHVRTANLAEPGAYSQVHRELHPEITFNLAGYGVDPEEREPRLYEAMNSFLVAEIAEAIAESPGSGWPGLRLVHVGSASEYGPVGDPLTESAPARPTSLYGQTKLDGTERLLAVRRRKGCRALVARLFTVYGPGEHPGRLLPSLLRAARTGERLALTSGTQRRDFTYVEDVAEGLLRLGVLDQVPGLVNLATGKLTPVRQFAECAARIVGLRPGQTQFGALPTRSDEPQQGCPDLSLLETLLGWRPATPIAEGIHRAWEFRRVGPTFPERILFDAPLG